MDVTLVKGLNHMKRLLFLLLAMAALSSFAFAQNPTGPIARTIPLNHGYGPLRSGESDCTPPGFLDSYTSGQATYNFPSGAPNAVTLTLTGSTNGSTFSTITTGTTTTGGAIAWSSEYTAVCITATTMTGAGVTVQGVFQGIPTIGSVTVDPTGLATSAKQDTGNTSLAAIDTAQGAKTDNKSTATDTTAVSVISLLKEASFQLQAIAALASTDPCAGANKTTAPISITTATTTVIIAASASNKAYICSINIGPIEAVADNIALVEDATGSCASPDAGIIGGVTAAKGWNFAASQGIVLGNGGATVAKTASTNVNVCLITDSAAEVPGVISYILAP